MTICFKNGIAAKAKLMENLYKKEFSKNAELNRSVKRAYGIISKFIESVEKTNSTENLIKLAEKWLKDNEKS